MIIELSNQYDVVKTSHFKCPFFKRNRYKTMDKFPGNGLRIRTNRLKSSQSTFIVVAFLSLHPDSWAMITVTQISPS